MRDDANGTPHPEARPHRSSISVSGEKSSIEAFKGQTDPQVGDASFAASVAASIGQPSDFEEQARQVARYWQNRELKTSVSRKKAVEK